MSMLNALSSASTEVAVVLAVDLPDGIGPTFTDQPWWPFALVLINSFLGLLAMVMFGLFFVGGSRVVGGGAGGRRRRPGAA